MRVPVVGLSPLKSTEQLAPLFIFFAFQILEYCEVQRRKRGLSFIQLTLLRVKVTAPILLTVVAAAAVLQLNYGYFGPPSARVRGLFVKHTRTGNPLVDSVAEHQPANAQAYQQYLHNVYDLAPVGFGLSFLKWSDANSFLILYAVIAYYFSNRMARLVILLGPVAAALGGVAVGFFIDQCILKPVGHLLHSFFIGPSPLGAAEADSADSKDEASNIAGADAANGNRRLEERMKASAAGISSAASKIYNLRISCALRIALGVYLARQTRWPVQEKAREFYKYSHELSEQLSQPSIMFKARLNNGQEIILDDYREVRTGYSRSTAPLPRSPSIRAASRTRARGVALISARIQCAPPFPCSCRPTGGSRRPRRRTLVSWRGGTTAIS